MDSTNLTAFMTVSISAIPVDNIMGLFFLAVCSSSGKLVKSADAILKKGISKLSKKSMLSSSHPEAQKSTFRLLEY